MLPIIIHHEPDVADEVGKGWVYTDPHAKNGAFLLFASLNAARDHAVAAVRDYVIISADSNPYAAQAALAAIWGDK